MIKPLLSLSFFFMVSVLQAQEWNESFSYYGEIEKAHFGTSLDLNGNQMIVGAPDESSEISRSGAVYIFEKSESGNWGEPQRVSSPFPLRNGEFGTSVAIHGNYAIVGAPRENEGENNVFGDAGAAHIFKKNENGEWVADAHLVRPGNPDENQFGTQVRIFEDFALASNRGDRYDENESNKIEYAGAVYCYRRDENGIWIKSQKLVSPERKIREGFGEYISVDGNQMGIGAKGVIYMFYKTNNLWEYRYKIVPETSEKLKVFGNEFVLYGQQLIIGDRTYEEQYDPPIFHNPYAGAVYVYQNDGNENWALHQHIIAYDFRFSSSFGSSVAVEDDLMVVGSSTASTSGGAIYTYRKVNDEWLFDKKVAPQGLRWADQFGGVVAIDKDRIAIGARGIESWEFDVNDHRDYGAMFIYENNDLNVNESELEDFIVCYPNPTFGRLNVYINKSDDIENIRLLNSVGKEIGNIKTGGFTQLFHFEINGAAGFYYLEVITNEGKRFHKKVLKNISF